MFKVPEQFRIKTGKLTSDESYGNNGAFYVPRGIGGKYFTIVASDGEGWEHVSISLPSRTPTWEEMCEIKSLFWDDEDCVVQFHPPKSNYVNNFGTCLHLWKKIGEEFPVPPSILVGLKL